MLRKMRKIQGTNRRTVGVGPMEGRLNEEEAGEREGDRGGGFRKLIGDNCGEQTTEGPPCTKSVFVGWVMRRRRREMEPSRN
jgi:hypothetical protein